MNWHFQAMGGHEASPRALATVFSRQNLDVLCFPPSSTQTNLRNPTHRNHNRRLSSRSHPLNNVSTNILQSLRLSCITILQNSNLPSSASASQLTFNTEPKPNTSSPNNVSISSDYSHSCPQATANLISSSDLQVSQVFLCENAKLIIPPACLKTQRPLLHQLRRRPCSSCRS